MSTLVQKSPPHPLLEWDSSANSGLIAYLAQIGCFVPAERAILGITDRIFTRIHTVDSTLRPESTFTHDVHQVAQMLNHSTPRSLLLIDEFVRRRSARCQLRYHLSFFLFSGQGKGTASVDGAALLLGIVEHLLARRLTTGTPKV
jgi:DNA mismatch repair protein MSH5